VVNKKSCVSGIEKKTSYAIRGVGWQQYKALTDDKRELEQHDCCLQEIPYYTQQYATTTLDAARSVNR
jgi:hypothetical protein